jgi:integrase
MYVASFYQGGIRFGDLVRIRKENFRNGRLQYTMHKGIRNATPSKINVPLHPVAKAIFKKYNYQFPAKINWDRPEESINNRNSIMNQTLRRVCGENGLPEVTFHTARHSVADLSVQKKLSPIQMKSILGHKKLSTTEVYMREFYSEQSDEAMNKLFS